MDLQKNKYNTKLVITEEHENLSHEEEDDSHDENDIKSPYSETNVITYSNANKQLKR